MDLKDAILSTIKRRNFAEQEDLILTLGGAFGGRSAVEVMLDKMISDGEIIFMEFVCDNKILQTLYFLGDTVCYEPGLSVKKYTIPDHVEKFFANMINRKVIEEEFVEGLDRAGKIAYYNAIHAYVQNGGKLNTLTTREILGSLVREGKVVLKE